jgi:hypothetical protein
MNSVTKYRAPISDLFMPVGHVCAKETEGASKTATKPAIKRLRAI